MSEVPHARELQPRPRLTKLDLDTAGAYARVFLGTEDGKRVMEDLRLKFGHSRQRFPKGQRPDHVAAAVIDGECNVLREIEQAVALGTPSTYASPPKP